MNLKKHLRLKKEYENQSNLTESDRRFLQELIEKYHLEFKEEKPKRRRKKDKTK